jgi:AraC-like DNA-binding protein
LGQTPLQFMQHCRMSRAADDIVDGRSSLGEIAFRYGYNSANGFLVAFQQVHGVTPGRYAERLV